MIKIIVAFMLSLAFVACSSEGEDLQNVTSKLVVGNSLANTTLNDQFEKSHTIPAGTKKVIFAFSKDAAHTCNDFFATQAPTYLQDNGVVFIADVSAAPSLIRSMFILPGLKDFKHTVLLLEEKSVAAPFRKGVDSEKVIVAYVKDGNISKVDSLTTKEELQKVVESK